MKIPSALEPKLWDEIKSLKSRIGWATVNLERYEVELAESKTNLAILEQKLKELLDWCAENDVPSEAADAPPVSDTIVYKSSSGGE